jgi:hypothetical protein
MAVLAEARDLVGRRLIGWWLLVASEGAVPSQLGPSIRATFSTAGAGADRTANIRVRWPHRGRSRHALEPFHADADLRIRDVHREIHRPRCGFSHLPTPLQTSLASRLALCAAHIRQSTIANPSQSNLAWATPARAGPQHAGRLAYASAAQRRPRCVARTATTTRRASHTWNT